MPFPFEKLMAYQKAVQWYRDIDTLLKENGNQISYGFSNQLRRAALSISLNLAEGNGRWHVGDKKQFFWVARGSAFECVPLLAILNTDGRLDEARHAELYAKIEELAKMITGLIQSVEKLNQSKLSS